MQKPKSLAAPLMIFLVLASNAQASSFLGVCDCNAKYFVPPQTKPFVLSTMMKMGRFPELSLCVAVEPKCPAYCETWLANMATKETESGARRFNVEDVVHNYKYQCIDEEGPIDPQTYAPSVAYNSGWKRIESPAAPTSDQSSTSVESQKDLPKTFYVSLSRSQIENVYRVGAALGLAVFSWGVMAVTRLLNALTLRYCPTILIQPMPRSPASQWAPNQCVVQVPGVQKQMRCLKISETLLRCST